MPVHDREAQEVADITRHINELCKLALQYQSSTRDGALTITQARLISEKMSPLMLRAGEVNLPREFIAHILNLIADYREVRCVADSPNAAFGFLSSQLALVITINSAKLITDYARNARGSS